MIHDAHVVLATGEFDADLATLTGDLGFRVDAIYPADSPSTAIVSLAGTRLRLERSDTPSPLTLHLLSDERKGTTLLPGGASIEFRPFRTTYTLPPNRPSLVITHAGDEAGVGRAGMRYRDLLPDRWGGRFIASHITIPDGGPVPDYVHFHKIRFQMIFVKSGWVEVVYEDQGAPFVMHAGDCVLQPPQIRHRVLTSSPGLEVIEIGCPAEHETIADHALTLPTGVVDPDRDFSGQRFVHHVADGAPYAPWRIGGWEYRDTGIGAATSGLAGVRVARPSEATSADRIAHDTELALLVVLAGELTFDSDESGPVRLTEASSVAIPGGMPYALLDPSANAELLDVTLPATVAS